MGFRDKMKKAIGGKKSGDSSPSGTATPKEPKPTKVQFYKDNEIPKSKYRGKMDPVHQERLKSFSFADAFGARKGSTNDSNFSPTASRAHSISSWKRAKSLISDGGPSRRQSVIPAALKENDADESDVANVGLSRPTTAEAKPKGLSNGVHVNGGTSKDLDLDRSATQKDNPLASHAIPFPPEELEKAMTAVTLENGN